MGDDAMDPAQGVNVAHKFVADKLMYGVIGPPMSHIAQATLKTYAASDMPMITTRAAIRPTVPGLGASPVMSIIHSMPVMAYMPSINCDTPKPMVTETPRMVATTPRTSTTWLST